MLFSIHSTLLFHFIFFSLSFCVRNTVTPDSEKTTNVHKSKYDFLLEQERKRTIRNTELLHMLENIDSDGMTATRTERFELLKVSVWAKVLAGDGMGGAVYVCVCVFSSEPIAKPNCTICDAKKHFATQQ